MATIQIKRALTFEGTAAEAISKVKELSGDNALKIGEPMVVRYKSTTGGENRFRYLLVVCTNDNPVSLTIYPSFDSIEDFTNYVNSIVVGGGGGTATTADQISYSFNEEFFGEGSNQKQFNDSVLTYLTDVESRLSWKSI